MNIRSAWKFGTVLLALLLLGMAAASAEDSLLIGAYSLHPGLWNDANVQMLEDAGIDLLLDVPADRHLLDLCLAHNIRVVVNDEFPGWWGGDGTNAGGYRDLLPLSEVEACADRVADHPAVWGDYLIDEPNSEDFPWIAEVFSRYAELLPQRQPFINLHPYYDDEASTAMLGAPYRQYLQNYVDTVPVSYLSFDSYPYSNPEIYGKTFLYGYDAAADVCRRSGRGLWVTQQVGGWEAADSLAEFQIRLQTSIALTYGARGIVYASWSADWWDDATTCVSADGTRNPAADSVERINRELRQLESSYLSFRNLCVLPLGNLDAADEYLRPQLLCLRDSFSAQPFDLCGQIDADGAILCGCFENTLGEKAVMLTNVNSLFDGSADTTVTLGFAGNGWVNGTSVADVAEILLHPGDAAFLLLPR